MLVSRRTILKSLATLFAAPCMPRRCRAVAAPAPCEHSIEHLSQRCVKCGETAERIAFPLYGIQWDPFFNDETGEFVAHRLTCTATASRVLSLSDLAVAESATMSNPERMRLIYRETVIEADRRSEKFTATWVTPDCKNRLYFADFARAC